jgi:predicted dehydrogenase
MGTTHALGWAETEAKIAGFAAETIAEAEPISTQYACRVYPDLAAMLPEVDLVDICTPTHLHYEMVLQAAAAGKDILCEKPLALTVAQAREMIAACRQAGVRLLVGHVVRFFPEYARAKSLVEAGEIGRPGVVRLHRGSYRPKKPVGNWFLDEARSGGILMDLMIHDFDYARWVAGEVTRVFAKKVTAGHPEAPVDYGLAILTHESGAISHIAGAWAYPPPTFRTGLEIAGEQGLIQFDSDETAPIRNLIMQPGGEAPDVAMPSSPLAESPYLTELKAFYQALREDRPARVSAEDGLEAVRIARAAIESIQTGAAVALESGEEVRS